MSDLRSFDLRRGDAQNREIWKDRIVGNRLTRSGADIKNINVFLKVMIMMIIDVL